MATSQVTARPSRLASRTQATPSRVDSRDRCTREPVTRASAKISAERDGLGARRNRRQSQPHGDLAVVRDAAPGQMRVLRPQPDVIAEGRGVLHRAQQHLRVRQRRVGMRKGDAARVGELAHFGDGVAPESGRKRADRVHVSQVERARAMLEHLHQAGLVQRRVGVGRAGEAGHAAGDRRLQLRFQRRLVFEAGLAQARRKIDQSGADDQPGRVDHPVRVPSRRRRADRRDLARGDEKRGLAIDAVARDR